MAAQFTKPFNVSGEELDLDQAEAVKEQGVRVIEAESGPFEVDLAGLQRANSVTVAVLMAWYRHALLLDKSITFVNLSRELLNIIEFSGLRRLLLGDGAEKPGAESGR